MKTLLTVGAMVAVAGWACGRGPRLSAPITYFGMCDASAAVALGATLFIVANDEDNAIRVYRRQPAAMPVSSFDLTDFLRLSGRDPESDLEGAARVGDRVYWVASHGRNAKGEASPNRQRFFATTVAVDGEVVTIQPIGAPYSDLLIDLQADPRLRPMGLEAAARLAPKLPGALNIEGLAGTPEGHLLIGFRNPIPDGLALLVPLLNPAEMIEGRRAAFGDPIRLNLGGLGVRSMGWGNGKYLIIAGHHDDDGISQLYEWAGPGAEPRVIEDVTFTGSNPEGIAFETENGAHDVFVLSDDGTLKIDGVGCKKIPDPAKRRFRAYRLDL
jgi:Protein of unknown function (DUF3616)